MEKKTAERAERRLDAARLRAFMERVFCAEGFSAADAARIADVLMTADLFGIESHGAQRMMYYHRNIASGSVDVRAEPEMLKETPVSALFDARFAMGQLAAARAMEAAVAKAKRVGIGIAAVRNSSHFGIAGYYALMAAREGLAGFAATNTGPIMPPTFGVDLLLGTNPIAFCMDAEPAPLLFDASTTVVTLGKVELYDKRAEPMPEGWTVDGEGRPCRDAARMNAAILAGGPGGILPLGGAGETLGGHKGYGLALCVEAITGVLSGGFLCPEMCGAHGDHTSHFFLAFDPALFGDPAGIRARLSDYLRTLRASARVPGASRVYTPGEKAYAAREDRLQHGVPVDDKTYKELIEIAGELGVEGV